MNTSKGFIDEPLTMVQREYVEKYGDNENNPAIALWSVYSYELAYLIAKEVKVKIPDKFPYWDTTKAITLHMKFDEDAILKSTPEQLKSLRASKPMMSFVWENSYGGYITFGVFNDYCYRVFRTMKFPLAFMLTRPSHDSIVVEYSTIVEAYQKALSER